eukprot:SAG31_NODE_2882_length_4955_cov_22.807455_3_plen_213_part_00
MQLNVTMARKFLQFGSTLFNRVRGGVQLMSELQAEAKEFEEHLRKSIPAAHFRSMDAGAAPKRLIVGRIINKVRACIESNGEETEETEKISVVVEQHRSHDATDENETGENETEQVPLLKDDAGEEHESANESGTFDMGKYLPDGKLPQLVGIDVVKGIMNRATEYTHESRGRCCSGLFTTACRTLTRSRSVLTQHENELGTSIVLLPRIPF